MKLWGNQIHGCIFDLDGTLLDSMQVWVEIDKKYMQMHHIEYDEKYTEIIKRLTFDESAQFFIDEFKLDKSKEMIMNEWRLMVGDAYFDTIPLKPYVKECLELLHESCELVIATSCEKHFAIAALTRLGVLDYFKSIVSTKDLGISKEQPLIFNLCASLLEMDADECMVFEDVHSIMKCASQASFKVCGVFDESSKNDIEENKKISDHYIMSFKELVEEIKINSN